MVVINEWLPNPVGSDATGEWVELWNNGASVANLAGWRLENGAGKKVVLSGNVAPNAYVLLKRQETKLTLRNLDETLSLYDNAGKLIDQSKFLGTATEGKTFARVGERFVISDPTPGAVNRAPASANILQNTYPMGQPLGDNVGIGNIILLALVLGVALAAAALYVLKSNENLSELFFGRY